MALSYNEVKGDLIKLALQGKFDVIAHGANCRSTMGAGIAVSMAKTFGCNNFPLELIGPDIRKLGNIDYKAFINEGDKAVCVDDIKEVNQHVIYVVNAYTQNMYGKNHKDGKSAPVDYEAITMCMRKMNVVFKGLHIGLPLIGAGLAGGNWNKINEIIKTELSDCHITIVLYGKQNECTFTGDKDEECWKSLGRCIICKWYK